MIDKLANASKPESENIWTCDFCGKEFTTKKEANSHELVCLRKPIDSKNKTKQSEIKMDYGKEFRDRMAKQKKADNFIGFIFTYIYPVLPVIELLSNKMKNGDVIGFLLPVLPFFLLIMIISVNTGFAGRGNIFALIFMVLSFWITVKNYGFVCFLFVMSLILVYGLGYYQLFKKKKKSLV